MEWQHYTGQIMTHHGAPSRFPVVPEDRCHSRTCQDIAKKTEICLDLTFHLSSTTLEVALLDNCWLMSIKFAINYQYL